MNRVSTSSKHSGDTDDGTVKIDITSVFNGGGHAIAGLADDHETTQIWGGEAGGDDDFVGFATYMLTDGVTVTFSGDESGFYNFVSTVGTCTFLEIESVYGTG